MSFKSYCYTNLSVFITLLIYFFVFKQTPNIIIIFFILLLAVLIIFSTWFIRGQIVKFYVRLDNKLNYLFEENFKFKSDPFKESDYILKEIDKEENSLKVEKFSEKEKREEIKNIKEERDLFQKTFFGGKFLE